MTHDSVDLADAMPMSIQFRTLSQLLTDVRGAVAVDVVPIIEVDLDLCALMPVHRTSRALAIVGEEFSIDVLLEPRSLPLLPGYSNEAWEAFVRHLGLHESRRELAWFDQTGSVNVPDSPYGVFHKAFWTAEWMYEDVPTPGLGAFVQRIEDAGGLVVFLSGRWLAEHRKPSRECLKRSGIRSPQLIIGNDNHETLVAPERAVSDSELKAARQPEILSRYGTPIAFIDDRRTNRNAVEDCLKKEIRSVAIAIPGFTYDPATPQAPLRLSTFEFEDTIIGMPPTART